MAIEQVEVGDWSKDGHNQSDKYTIDVPDGIDSEGAYQLAVRELGFTMGDFCQDYEDNVFPVENYIALLEAAKKYNVPVVMGEYGDLFGDERDYIDLEESDDGEKIIALDPDTFFGLWLAMLNIGIVITRGGLEGGRLAYEVKSPKGKTHYIGGYGLYWN